MTRLLPLLLLATALGAAEPAAAPSSSARLTPIPFPVDTQDTEYARRAAALAIDEWVTGFLSRGVPAKRFAVLPLGRDIDGNYFTEQVRNSLASRASGTDYSVYSRDDDTWKSLVAEIRKGDQFGDTMDAATIQKFGRVQGVQGLIVGRISSVHLVAGEKTGAPIQFADENRSLQVRVSLQAYEVETGRLLWGAEKAGTVALPAATLEVPVSRAHLMLWAAGGLAGLVLLAFVFGRLKSAFRPR